MHHETSKSSNMLNKYYFFYNIILNNIILSLEVIHTKINVFSKKVKTVLDQI